ncbi:hypothetical protein FBUS_09497 [Fasciolopsis buskii]|uniref:Uncharacterized protein n=1 Tax=Fasciolopsis buskii TaxID=27845 RepID=A0A8E0RKR5_9TREM|nr:hypothetical protein FBUS_09497 [Fasciolopsis buski]
MTEPLIVFFDTFTHDEQAQLAVSAPATCVSVEAVPSDYQQISTSENVGFTKLDISTSKEEVSQDIDYEEISSNEELFSEIDEADLVDMHRQFLHQSNRSEPHASVSEKHGEVYSLFSSHRSIEQVEQPIAPLTSEDEWSQASTSAQFLVTAAGKFNPSHVDFVSDHM